MGSEVTIYRVNRPLKRLLMFSVVFMLIGTGLELYLLDHYEDAFQLIPIISLGLALLSFVLLVFQPTKLVMRLFKLSLLLSALSGVYGTFLHLKSNYQFEAEMKPKADSWTVLVESLSGALPTLAPASMILFALIGYSYLILINGNK